MTSEWNNGEEEGDQGQDNDQPPLHVQQHHLQRPDQVINIFSVIFVLSEKKTFENKLQTGGCLKLSRPGCFWVFRMFKNFTIVLKYGSGCCFKGSGCSLKILRVLFDLLHEPLEDGGGGEDVGGGVVAHPHLGSAYWTKSISFLSFYEPPFWHFSYETKKGGQTHIIRFHNKIITKN